MGGHTAFADTRTAFEELSGDMKVSAHSMWHSRKLAAPGYFANVKPEDYTFGRHRLVQLHEPSERMNLYIAAHVHHLEGMDRLESDALIKRLYEHAMQEEFVLEIEWKGVGDLVIWDYTCTMHRAVGGDFLRMFRRDMRRVTVHDGSSTAWGLNEKTDRRQGMP